MTASPVEPGSAARDPLDAIREALGIPNRATVGDQEIRDRILVDRARHPAAMLPRILRGNAPDDIGWAVGYLRERLAGHPAGS